MLNFDPWAWPQETETSNPMS